MFRRQARPPMVVAVVFPSAFWGWVIPFGRSGEPSPIQTSRTSASAIPHRSGILLGKPPPLDLSLQVYTVVRVGSLSLSLSRKLKSRPNVPPAEGRGGFRAVLAIRSSSHQPVASLATAEV